GDGTKCHLARYDVAHPYYRDRTCHICRRRGPHQLSQRSSHHEVHLRTTELRLLERSHATQRDQMMNTSEKFLRFAAECEFMASSRTMSAHCGSSTKRHQKPTRSWAH